MTDKKAQSMGLNIVIIAAIALVVLVVIIFLVIEQTKKVSDTLKDCRIEYAGQCAQPGNGPDGYREIRGTNCDPGGQTCYAP